MSRLPRPPTIGRMKTTASRLVSLLLCLTLAGCGGGSAATSTLPSNLRGLPNLGATCFVNAALQVIAHSPTLRARAAANWPQLGLEAFFQAYDSGQPQALLTALQGVVGALRASAGYASCAGAGSLASLWDNGLAADPPGLALGAYSVTDPAQIPQQLAQGQREFLMAVAQVAGTVTGGPLDYASLASPQRLQALVYNTGGHYVAYLSQAGSWYALDDAQVSAVTPQALAALPIGLGVGFELAVYSSP